MTYVVLAPEHPLVDSCTTSKQADAVAKLRASASQATDIERMSSEGSLEKRGAFTGSYCVNHSMGNRYRSTSRITCSASYGTGAIMAVPAEDERDYDFAVAHALPIIRTVATPEGFTGVPTPMTA